jgi:aryl-alcohol dehydrogenase-like predicted oxidoreductase
LARGVDDALARMRTDVVDVFHLHSCPREILEQGDVIVALERARDAGKVHVIAYSGENDALSWAASSGRFGALQCSVNLFDQRSLETTIARAPKHGIIAIRALANAPWRFRERPEGHYAETYWLRMRAMGIDAVDWSDMALRFAAFAPGVSVVLAGTATAAHLEANARAVARGPLPAELENHIRGRFRAAGADWAGEV